MSQQELERAALMTLLKSAKSYQQVTEQVSNAGSALALLGGDTLFPDEYSADLAPALDALSAWSKSGLHMTTILDDDYPEQLREIQEMPPFLFWQGNREMDARAASVVGSRDASALGLSFASEVARRLVESGFAVIAGLARGIDTEAHRAALASGGRTVAVIGTGIRKYYPAENRDLQDRIAKEGLLLSQFWPDASPTKQSFPIRNAVMSGYGCASIIVEASERSGTRSQARRAIAHGRPVIIRRSVLEQAEWARVLEPMPSVYVVDEPEEAVNHVVQLSDQSASVMSELTGAI